MTNTFLKHRQMSEVEARCKIFSHLSLKFSSLDTIFIPTDEKELLKKIDENDIFLREQKKLEEDQENVKKK